MNSIIRLRQEDFFVDAGTKGNILCTGIKGFSLCMFYSPYCKISEALLPKFRHLPQVINGCKFCLLNINENQGVIALSKQTIAPIEYVPYIVFQVNGRPFLAYDDDPTLEKLINFVSYSMKLIGNNKSFVDKGARVESDVPKVKIGVPYLDFKCDPAGFCYLSYTDAYGKAAKSGQGGNQPEQTMEASSATYFQRS